MRQKSVHPELPSERIVKNIRRATRKRHSSEEKIRIVLDGLRGESSIAELCRREGIAEGLYYAWSKEFLEAGKRRLAGDTARAATSGEVKDLRRQAQELKAVVAEQALELRLLKKKHDRGWGRRGMRYPASEKLEIIRLVEQSHLPVRRTLEKLGIQPADSTAGTIACRPADQRKKPPQPLPHQMVPPRTPLIFPVPHIADFFHPETPSPHLPLISLLHNHHPLSHTTIPQTTLPHQTTLPPWTEKSASSPPSLYYPPPPTDLFPPTTPPTLNTYIFALHRRGVPPPPTLLSSIPTPPPAIPRRPRHGKPPPPLRPISCHVPAALPPASPLRLFPPHPPPAPRSPRPPPAPPPALLFLRPKPPAAPAHPHYLLPPPLATSLATPTSPRLLPASCALPPGPRSRPPLLFLPLPPSSLGIPTPLHPLPPPSFSSFSLPSPRQNESVTQPLSHDLLRNRKTFTLLPSPPPPRGRCEPCVARYPHLFLPCLPYLRPPLLLPPPCPFVTWSTLSKLLQATHPHHPPRPDTYNICCALRPTHDGKTVSPQTRAREKPFVGLRSAP